MTGQVQGKPAVPEQPGLQARRVRHGNDEHPAGDDEARRVAQRTDRPAKVFKRVPEDDRGPGSGHFLELDVAHVGVGFGSVRIDANRVPGVLPEGRDECPVTGPDIEDRPLRQDPVQTAGQG